MNRYIYFLLSCCLVLTKIQGQNHLDSLKSYLKQKPKLTGYFDGRNSFTASSKNTIFGAFVGANYGNRLDAGLAWYTTYNEPEVYEITDQGTLNQDTIFHKSVYNYFSLRAAYQYYQSKKWEFYIPIGIGIGQAAISSYKKNPLKPFAAGKEEPRFMPLDMGIDGTYLITPWFVFSGGMGYRINLAASKQNQLLNAVYYRFGFGFRFGYIYKKIKGTKIGKRCCCCLL